MRLRSSCCTGSRVISWSLDVACTESTSQPFFLREAIRAVFSGSSPTMSACDCTARVRWSPAARVELRVARVAAGAAGAGAVTAGMTRVAPSGSGADGAATGVVETGTRGRRQMRTEDARLIQSFWSHLLSSHSTSCSMPLSARRRQSTILPEYQSKAVKSAFA